MRRTAEGSVDKDMIRTAEGFFKGFLRATSRQRARLSARAPLEEIHYTALHHPDAFVRRGVLGYLDHYANDKSMAVFAQALGDPVDFVRNIALHSLACEACKTDELCPTDVVPGLLDVMRNDPSPELRMKAIPLLLRLAPSDVGVRAAVEQCARADADDIVRTVANDALAGRHIMPRKRYQREQRRHARRRPISPN